VQASEVSLGDDVERFDVERLIGNDLLEPAILVLKLPALDQITDFQAAVLRPPAVQCRLVDAVLATETRGLSCRL
jgi:hypothetical protein